MSDIMWYLSFSVWLSSLRMIISRSICFAAHSLPTLSWILLYYVSNTPYCCIHVYVHVYIHVCKQYQWWCSFCLAFSHLFISHCAVEEIYFFFSAKQNKKLSSTVFLKCVWHISKLVSWSAQKAFYPTVHQYLLALTLSLFFFSVNSLLWCSVS